MELRQVTPKEETVGYICDVCRNPCFKEAGEQRLLSTEYATLSAEWGFWSNDDCTYHECHLCESCYERVRQFIEKELGGKVRIIEHSPGMSPRRTCGEDYVITEQNQSRA